MYDICSISRIGQRDRQEDAIYTEHSHNELFATLCDGMGGVAGGYEAANMTIEILKKYYYDFRQERSSNRWMIDASEEADDKVFHLMDDSGERIGAGSTLIAVYLRERKLNWIGVGDSRIYVLRGNAIIRVTSDHTWFNTIKSQYTKGEISKEQFDIEAKSGDSLVSYIGMGGLTLIDTNDEPFRLNKGDVIILCSDGLYKNVSDSDISNIVKKGRSAEDTVKALEDKLNAIHNPCQDNYSFILIRLC